VQLQYKDERNAGQNPGGDRVSGGIGSDRAASGKFTLRSGENADLRRPAAEEPSL
jgi:hypothetical protein